MEVETPLWNEGQKLNLLKISRVFFLNMINKSILKPTFPPLIHQTFDNVNNLAILINLIVQRVHVWSYNTFLTQKVPPSRRNCVPDNVLDWVLSPSKNYRSTSNPKWSSNIGGRITFIVLWHHCHYHEWPAKWCCQSRLGYGSVYWKLVNIIY